MGAATRTLRPEDERVETGGGGEAGAERERMRAPALASRPASCRLSLLFYCLSRTLRNTLTTLNTFVYCKGTPVLEHSTYSNITLSTK